MDYNLETNITIHTGFTLKQRIIECIRPTCIRLQTHVGMDVNHVRRKIFEGGNTRTKTRVKEYSASEGKITHLTLNHVQKPTRA